ncbi:MAG: Cell division protein FtsA [Chloroflexi bacterium]|nr:Cell division protein FtsA [Chloroflexota bacterium]
MAKTIAAIDAGTSKVCSIIANVRNGAIEVVGTSLVPSRGIHKGLVTNIEEATQAVQESVMKTERICGLKMNSAYVSVTGSHISSMNSRGVVATMRSDKRVTSDELERVLESARSIPIPSDKKILHVIPRHYMLDEHVKVKEPVGMHGFRLDVETHVVVVAAASVQNVIKSVRGAGVEIEDLVFSPLATGEAVLSEDERNSGVILADIGGGTTDIAIFKNGCIFHSAVLPVGGYQVTRDIAIGLGLANELAEGMKTKYANLRFGNGGADLEDRELETQNRHTTSTRDLNNIVRLRVEEILRLILLEIPQGKREELVPAGLVLTGGTANIPGIDILAQDVFGTPHVRVGVPAGITGITDSLHDPATATSAGLLLWGVNQGKSEDKWTIEELRPGVAGTVKGRLLSIRKIFKWR